MGGVEQFISNYYHHSDFTLEAFRDLELTISKDYLQAAINIYPNNTLNKNINNKDDLILLLPLINRCKANLKINLLLT